MARSWAKASGWEYDILRLLPKDEAKEVYARGSWEWRKRGLSTWWFGPLLFLIAFGFLVVLMLISVAAEALGLGEVETIVAVLVTMKLCHYWAFRCVLPKVLRPFVREQLYRLAQLGLPRNHPLMQVPLPEERTTEGGAA